MAKSPVIRGSSSQSKQIKFLLEGVRLVYQTRMARTRGARLYHRGSDGAECGEEDVIFVIAAVCSMSLSSSGEVDRSGM